MKFQVTAGGSSVPPGMYRGKFIGVQDQPPHPEYGRGVRFEFMVIGGEYDGETASAICGTKNPASPKNRLGRILAGIAGSPVTPGTEIDADLYVGQVFLIQVEQAPSGTGTRVGAVMPNL